MPNFLYPPSTIDQYAQYAAQAFANGQGLQVTFDPSDGTFTGLVAIESGSPLARQIAERAERRASTLNV
ncbi:hypothetical protein [Streptomyces chartreusis]